MAELTLSAFDVIGPIMIGPSSSHTAGAARIGFAARLLLNDAPIEARIELHGSFAATGRGHATDRALIAGLLGLAPDNHNLPHALSLASAQGMKFDFAAADLGEDAHPNSVRLRLKTQGHEVIVIGASLGGGIIEISSIDDHPVRFAGNRPTLVCWHTDQPGFLAAITATLASAGMNIATLTTSRRARGGHALTVIETDSESSVEITAKVSRVTAIKRFALLPILP